MGVINLTPDSFSDGGELNSSKKVLDQVNQFLCNGVDVIDLGAQSTRPGAEEVGPSIEIKRLIPYLKLIKSEYPDVLISIDTFKCVCIFYIICDINSLRCKLPRVSLNPPPCR